MTRQTLYTSKKRVVQSAPHLYLQGNLVPISSRKRKDQVYNFQFNSVNSSFLTSFLDNAGGIESVQKLYRKGSLKRLGELVSLFVFPFYYVKVGRTGENLVRD